MRLNTDTRQRGNFTNQSQFNKGVSGMWYARSKGRGRPARQSRPQFAGVSIQAVIAVVAMLCVLLGIVVSEPVSASASGNGSAGGGNAKHAWCGDVGLPDCPQASPDWVSVSSDSPSAVATAIAQSRMFRAEQTHVGGLALDTPALVHLLVSRGRSDYWTHDHWVVSAKNGQGKEIGVFDFVYDQANHRIRFAVFGHLAPSDPRYGHAFPYSTPSGALARLRTERGLAASSQAQPELVFFPPAPAAIGANAVGPAQSTVQGAAQGAWGGGGVYPSDPMWMVPGADGHAYFVGSDTHVYTANELPIAG